MAVRSGRPAGEDWRRRRDLMALLPVPVVRYLYEEAGLSSIQIAGLLGVSDDTVRQFMHRHGLERRTDTAGVRLRGRTDRIKRAIEDFTPMKGARGYEVIYAPEHPRADTQGYVKRHIVIEEQKIGRPLRPDEVVHHINGVRNDNRPENLQVMTDHDHRSYHAKEAWRRRKEAMARRAGEEEAEHA